MGDIFDSAGFFFENFSPMLEPLSWASQIVLVLLTVFAVFSAVHQVSTFKLFELSKFIQDENFRLARRIVIQCMPAENGCECHTKKEIEAAASTCCAQYDIVGNILMFGRSKRLTRHFVSNWADSITRTYECLRLFMEERRVAGGNDYKSFAWLYREAMKSKS